MGKIRVKTLGDEEQEQKQAEEAKRKAEAKRAAIEAQKTKAQEKAESSDVIANDSSAEDSAKVEVKQSSSKNEVAADSENENTKKEKPARNATQRVAGGKEKFQTIKKGTHSKSYKNVAQKVDAKKQYSLSEALDLLPTLSRAKFDETVELHINTSETGISGNVTLPHGTGKSLRIKIVNATEDPKGVDEFVASVESGTIDFDILVATPDSMPKLARIAKVLGPKGLMPNPKNGTVTPKPEIVAKQFEGGQVNFKTEAKAPIIHASVGKVSFGKDKLSENITLFLNALPKDKVKNVTLKSTMSPGMKIA